MVDIKDTIKDMSPEERIKFLQKIKQLQEEKLKVEKEKRKKEFEELKKKTKKLEDELSEEINDSVEELTVTEARKNKKDTVEEKIFKMQASQGMANYNSLIEQIGSNNRGEQRNAYNTIKDIANQNSGQFDYNSINRIKDFVENIQNIEDEFHYVERSKSIINQIFDKIKENYKTDDH
jgi:Fe-S cluster assembly scaffold protein SufB